VIVGATPRPAEGCSGSEVLAPAGRAAGAGTAARRHDHAGRGHRRRIRSGRRRRARRRRAAGAGEPAVQRRRDQQGRRRAGRFASSWPPWPTVSSATDSAWCTASRRACTTSPSCCRTRPAVWCWPRSRLLKRLTQTPQSAVRRGAWRIQGVGQARRDREPAGHRRPVADRRRHGVHLPQGWTATRWARALLEEDQLDTVRGYVELARAKGVELVLPVDIVAATAFSADAQHDVVAADAIPADRLGLDIGRRPRSCSRASWPTRPPCSGTARWACSSWSRTATAPGPWPRR